MPKKIIIIASLVILAIVVSAVAATLLTRPQRQQKVSPAIATPAPTELISFSLKSSNSNLHVGDKVNVSLSLTGTGAKNVSGFDVKINYDKTKLRLAGATPGTFFSKYLTVKWDLVKAWFAATLNPGASASPEVNAPLLTLEFSAVSKSDSTSVSLTPDSIVVYSTNNTRSYPQGNTIILTIK